MCITSEDVRSQEEALTWDILCNECIAKAEKLLDERKAYRAFRHPYGGIRVLPQMYSRDKQRI